MKIIDIGDLTVSKFKAPGGGAWRRPRRKWCKGVGGDLQRRRVGPSHLWRYISTETRGCLTCRAAGWSTASILVPICPPRTCPDIGQGGACRGPTVQFEVAGHVLPVHLPRDEERSGDCAWSRLGGEWAAPLSIFFSFCHFLHFLSPFTFQTVSLKNLTKNSELQSPRYTIQRRI